MYDHTTSLALKDIACVRNYFRAREDNNMRGHDSALQKSFVDALVGMITCIKCLGNAGATQLIEALKDNPYGDVQTRRIRDHIYATMQHSCKAATTDEPKQHLKHWWHDFTKHEWDVLRNPNNSFNLKMTTLVARGHSVGCGDLDVQALKWALAALLVVHYYDDLPPVQQMYKKLQALKQSYATERTSFLHEQLPTFPEDPNELPEQIYKEAYPIGEPTKVVLQGVNTVAEMIPLRRSGRLLKAGRADRVDAHEAVTRVTKQIPPSQEHASAPSLTPTDDPDEVALFGKYQRELNDLRRRRIQGQVVSQEQDFRTDCEPLRESVPVTMD